MACDYDTFTFHNVSINTEYLSAMLKYRSCFTFHNVSINTKRGCETWQKDIIFTFHNVSINTGKALLVLPEEYFTLHSTMFLLIRSHGRLRAGYGILYIPQCFY